MLLMYEILHSTGKVLSVLYYYITLPSESTFMYCLGEDMIKMMDPEDLTYLVEK